MAADIQRLDQSRNFRSLRYDDPIVIGASALVLGYVIGSGRWKWLGNEVARIAGSLGTLAANYVYESLQDRNPQFFGNRPRVTH